MVPTTNKTSIATVRSRFLHRSEHAMASELPTVPLVLEPADRDVGTDRLKVFLREHHQQVMDDLATHGAVLLRGFPVNTIADFEDLITAIPTLRGINEFLMSEAGRELVSGTRYVFHTSTAYKTGGTLDFGAFHTENFYVPDIPRFICFYCVKPPRLGGETGLLNVARLLEHLPSGLREKLEARTFLASVNSFQETCERYSCSSEVLERFCTEESLPLEIYNDQKVIVFYKPVIVVHPVTGERSLCVNFAGEFEKQGLRSALIESFSADYSGIRWAVHRMYWKYKILLHIKHLAVSVSIAFRLKVPWAVIRQHIWSRIGGRSATGKPFHDVRIGDVFSSEDVKNLARLMRKNFSSFLWRRGDVLILDNLKMAHAGMPGFGSRELKALMCNPIVMPCTAGTGVFAPPPWVDSQTLGAKLNALVKTHLVNRATESAG